MDNITTAQQAIATLNEAGDFLNEVEDELYDKVDIEITGKIETAFLEIDAVLGYLQTINKENK